MGMDAKELEARLQMPPPANIRNINIDTHIGQAPQRPYALLEDHMASIVNGYRTVDDLKQALAGDKADVPDGWPDPNAIIDEGGMLFREVPSQDPHTFVVRDGEIQEDVIFERRAVSLSMQGARIGSENGTPTDYYNGFTWLRDGYKPEKDFPVMAQAAARGGANRRVFSKPASPDTAATLQHEVNRMNLAAPPVPRAPVERSEHRAPRREEK